MAVTACWPTTMASRMRWRCGVPGRRMAWTATCCSRGTSTAAARNCCNKLYASVGANVVSFPYGPHPTQPLGWYKKPITKVEDFKGMKFRTVGISIDLFTAMGAAVNALPGGEIIPAMDRGLLDGAEFNNASSDRLLGFPDVSKVCMLQSFHQNAEQFEILFNKTKYDALPDKMRAIIANAVEAASADMTWKAIDRYSKDYVELQTKDNVKFYKTPDAILQKQLEMYDQIVAKKMTDNPMFKEIIESQKAFGTRAVKWDMDTYVNRRMAFNHYFGEAGHRDQEGLSAIRRNAHHPAWPGWCFFCRSPRLMPLQPAHDARVAPGTQCRNCSSPSTSSAPALGRRSPG